MPKSKKPTGTGSLSKVQNNQPLTNNLNAIGELVARYGYEIVAKYLVTSRNGFIDGNLVRKIDHADFVAVKEEVDLEKEVDGLTDETLGLQFGIIHTRIRL